MTSKYKAHLCWDNFGASSTVMRLSSCRRLADFLLRRGELGIFCAAVEPVVVVRGLVRLLIDGSFQSVRISYSIINLTTGGKTPIGSYNFTTSFLKLLISIFIMFSPIPSK